MKLFDLMTLVGLAAAVSSVAFAPSPLTPWLLLALGGCWAIILGRDPGTG